MSGRIRLGVLVVDDRVILSCGDVDVRVDSEGARTLATLLLSAADLADAVSDDAAPTSSSRGDA